MRLPFLAGVTALAICCSASASAQNTATSKYTWGPLDRKVQGLLVATNVPSGCHWTVSDGGAKWTNAQLNFTFTWKGTTAYKAWIWDQNTFNPNTNAYGDNVSTASNTIDTQVEAGAVDLVNAVAQVEYRTARMNGSQYIFLDSDVSINSAVISAGQFWCSNSLPIPTNLYDFSSVVMHELGHAIGMNHDEAPDAIETVVEGSVNRGVNKRTLTTRDVERAVYLYGV